MSWGGRRLLPGLGAILFAAQLNVMLSRSADFLNDPGTGWHLQAGRLMLERKHWIDVDPFSFTHAGEPWIAFEWLSEVIFSLIERAGGLGGLVWCGFCLFALIPILLLRWLIDNEIPREVAFPYAVGALLVFQAHALARPHVFTYLGFCVLLLLTGRSMVDGPVRRQWLVLPPLFALWANLHGGFVAGLVWLGARAVGFAFDRGSLRAAQQWMGLLAVCTAATLVNPYGARLHWKIWQTVAELQTVRYWEEFAPPDFYAPSLLAAVVLAIVFLLLLGMRTVPLRALPWEQFFPTLVFLFLAFKSQRHVFLLVLVAAVPVCRAAVGMLPPLPNERLVDRWRRFDDSLQKALGDWWAVPVVAGLFGAWLIVSGLPQTLRVGEAHLSRAGAEFLKANLSRLRRPLTTTGNGGVLLYYFFPDLHVSFDDRSDFYGDRVNARFLGLFEMRPGWRAMLAEERFDSAILSPGTPLAQGLALLADWREVYRDERVVIFLHESNLDRKIRVGGVGAPNSLRDCSAPAARSECGAKARGEGAAGRGAQRARRGLRRRQDPREFPIEGSPRVSRIGANGPRGDPRE